MINNEAINNLLTRTSVRRFTEEVVSEEELDTLLHAAMAAPSSMNFQPWHFVVIRNQQMKEKLRTALSYAKMITEYTTCIVVCGDISLYERINKIEGEDNTLYWVQDCSAASENLLLAVHALGLGAVWTGIYPLESRVSILRNLLQIPENIVPLNLIVVGHPVKATAARSKWNADKIHYEQYG